MNDIRVARTPGPGGRNPRTVWSFWKTGCRRYRAATWLSCAPPLPDGVQGQATIVVEAEESTAPATGVYPVEEGDTLVSIAEEVGTTPEDLAELNPELGGEEPSPGDELDVPGPDYSGEDTVKVTWDGGVMVLNPVEGMMKALPRTRRMPHQEEADPFPDMGGHGSLPGHGRG